MNEAFFLPLLLHSYNGFLSETKDIGLEG